MSAFHCTAKHIAAVASYGAGSQDEAALVASLLSLANAASVAYRYRDDREVVDVPTADVAHYFSHPLSAPQVLKLTACLDYQSCECPGWPMSHAKSILENIRTTATLDRYGDAGTDQATLAADPGYRDAAWSI